MFYKAVLCWTAAASVDCKAKWVRAVEFTDWLNIESGGVALVISTACFVEVYYLSLSGLRAEGHNIGLL